MRINFSVCFCACSVCVHRGFQACEKALSVASLIGADKTILQLSGLLLRKIVRERFEYQRYPYTTIVSNSQPAVHVRRLRRSCVATSCCRGRKAIRQPLRRSSCSVDCAWRSRASCCRQTATRLHPVRYLPGRRLEITGPALPADFLCTA